VYSEEDINSAVEAGALNQQAATAFRNHVAKLRNTPSVDDEHFRLITGFNDIFVVIACALLLISVSWITGPAIEALSAWLLAEYFTRKRHMALPSIVLLLAFVGGVLSATMEWSSFKTHMNNSDIAMALSFAATALAAWLHWLRFKVPITVAAGSVALAAVAVSMVLYSAPGALQYVSLLLFTAGLCIFALAMRWDSSDTQRLTRRSDVAFWLHLAAAPLLIHPVFQLLDILDGNATLTQGMLVIVLYAFIALLSLCIDRRALMVSALGYVLYTLTELLRSYGSLDESFGITAFVIGSGLLLLSVFWQNCRAALLRFLPAVLLQRLPPLK